MARDESNHALPAWLQDELDPQPAPPTPRRGLRRTAARAAEERTADPAPQTASVASSLRTAAPVRSTATPLPPDAAPIPPSAAPHSSMPASIVPPASVPFSIIPIQRDPEPVVVVQEPAVLPDPVPEPELDTVPVSVSELDPVSEPELVEEPEPERAVEPEPEPVREPDPAPAVNHDPGLAPYPAPGSTTASDHQPSNLDLASGVLVRRSRRAPSGGWRRGVHRITGGLFNPGESSDDAHHDDLVARIRQPIGGDYRIAVLSLKGGVGKTTTTIGVGSTFASMRGDCVIAVDANPDFGTLAQRIPEQTQSTVRDLIAVADRIERYSDVRAHTSQAPSRLEVLASERDPAVSEAFSEDDYRRVIDILQVYYNIILTDCGTGIMHSAMKGVLDLANALVLVGSPAVDGARSAAATLDWLQHHGYSELVDRTVVVISSPRPGTSNIDLDALTEHFLARCRAVQIVPFDEHLAEGAEIDLNLLRPATRRAFAELAAMVADDFPVLTGRHSAHW